MKTLLWLFVTLVALSTLAFADQLVPTGTLTPATSTELGRCCYPTGGCQTNSQEECAQFNGVWTLGLTCEGTPCPTSNCDFPYTEVDMGDLPACGYPTLVNNPAHGLSGVAWLGACVTGEEAPQNLVLDRSQWCQAPGSQDRGRDACDDGVAYFGQPWMPCTIVTVAVQVTTGPNYARYVECGHQMYLSGWKDGNLDGDFCDTLCDGTAPEWIVEDAVVRPGVNVFSFRDPGVFNLGIYPGVFRWRLTSHPVGARGFGLVDERECPEMECGTFALDYIGEVEDYFLCDVQLPVDLTAFTALPAPNQITLKWTTASETHNDHFEIVRDGIVVDHIATLGNGPSGHQYSWVDGDVSNGTRYTYELFAVDQTNNRVKLSSTEATPTFESATVTEFALLQNYPNPFNPTTSIAFDVPFRSLVTIKVFNMVGQEVATVVNGEMAQGRHVVGFDGAQLPSALYLYRITAGDFTATRKMLLLK